MLSRLGSTALKNSMRVTSRMMSTSLYKSRAFPFAHDAMQVKLVSYSEPTDEIKQQGVENLQDLSAYCARVSNPDNQNNKKTNGKLLDYLMKHKHWSPFETVSACLQIDTTRDIARQILRHRSFSFQEFSQRYANPTEDMSFVLRDPRLQDLKNRQNSVIVEDVTLYDSWFDSQEELIQHSLDIYKSAIDKGIAKEQARVVLPEGNTMSRVYMNGTLRSWLHYIDLRIANGTQQEHMDVAKECVNALAPVFPMVTGLNK